MVVFWATIMENVRSLMPCAQMLYTLLWLCSDASRKVESDKMSERWPEGGRQENSDSLRKSKIGYKGRWSTGDS